MSDEVLTNVYLCSNGFGHAKLLTLLSYQIHVQVKKFNSFRMEENYQLFLLPRSCSEHILKELGFINLNSNRYFINNELASFF